MTGWLTHPLGQVFGRDVGRVGVARGHRDGGGVRGPGAVARQVGEGVVAGPARLGRVGEGAVRAEVQGAVRRGLRERGGHRLSGGRGVVGEHAVPHGHLERLPERRHVRVVHAQGVGPGVRRSHEQVAAGDGDRLADGRGGSVRRGAELRLLMPSLAGPVEDVHASVGVPLRLRRRLERGRDDGVAAQSEAVAHAHAAVAVGGGEPGLLRPGVALAGEHVDGPALGRLPGRRPRSCRGRWRRSGRSRGRTGRPWS